MAGEVEAVAADGAPVGGAVVGVRAEAELGGDELPEREFGGAEHVFLRIAKGVGQMRG